MNFLKDLNFKQSQFPVGDNEEISTTTGRIKKRHLPEFFLKTPKLSQTPTVLAGLQLLELGP